jgi:hypothetical protein
MKIGRFQLAFPGSESMACLEGHSVNVGSPYHPSMMGVLVANCTSEETEMMIRKSAGHSTCEASNDRGGKDPR